MRRILMTLATAAILTGCGLPPLDPAEAAQATDLELCQTFAFGRDFARPDFVEVTRAELGRRGAMTAQDWRDVDAQRVRIGQREHVAVCAWGPYLDINETVVPGLRSRQFVMGDLGPYVYTDGRRVTSWQQ